MWKGRVLINVNDIVGKRIGKLEVKAYAGAYRSDTLGGERVRHTYMCQCDCGKSKIIQRARLLSGTVYSCGCLRGKRYGD